MIKIKRLFNFNLYNDNDFIEIGGGCGDLSHNLIESGYNFVLFIEPDIDKFNIAQRKLKNIDCFNIEISKINFEKIKCKSSRVTVIMQDVIEHISASNQKEFFAELKKKYKVIDLIGRTPNLKSPFGLRNSFGDNTHLYRFTDRSLEDFLKNMGFINIKILGERYKITGIISFLRYPFYFLTIFICSLKFFSVYGCWEGFLTPNIVFYSENL